MFLSTFDRLSINPKNVLSNVSDCLMFILKRPKICDHDPEYHTFVSKFETVIVNNWCSEFINFIVPMKMAIKLVFFFLTCIVSKKKMKRINSKKRSNMQINQPGIILDLDENNNTIKHIKERNQTMNIS